MMTIIRVLLGNRKPRCQEKGKDLALLRRDLDAIREAKLKKMEARLPVRVWKKDFRL